MHDALGHAFILKGATRSDGYTADILPFKRDASRNAERSFAEDEEEEVRRMRFALAEESPLAPS
jgi:hypothetical protein